MHIQRFHEMVDVASSKAKPKTLTLATTCGKTLKFLCKQEKDGDLRKDARMMEVNALLNRILQEDPEGRKRNLRLRTYSVTCLNEECGLLEWVENTSCKLCAVLDCAGQDSMHSLLQFIHYLNLTLSCHLKC
jgi:serine/threonine-protein kinase ATR